MLTLAAAAPGGTFAQDTRLYERSVGGTNVLLDYWFAWLGLIALLMLFAWLSSRHKRVSALEARCKAAFADIDAFLVERHALIPNLVAVTKEHADQELEVLDRLLDAQQQALETLGHNRMVAETEVGNAVNQLINAGARMPDLSSSAQFIELRRDLTRIEERVTAARRFYNTTVAEYDAERGGFVSGMLAQFAKLPAHECYDLGTRRAELEAPQRVVFG